MRKNFIAFYFLILICSLSSYSQTITLKGVVKDTTATPLSYANVIAIPQDSTKTMSFAITDDEGRYQLLIYQEPYTISVSYFGFKTNTFKFNGQQNVTKNQTTNNECVKKNKPHGLP